MTAERATKSAPEGLDRPSTSLLVRCWVEPRHGEGEEPVVRAYVRNLKTGEERFVGDVEAVARLILGELRPGEGEAGEGARAVGGMDIAERSQ